MAAAIHNLTARLFLNVLFFLFLVTAPGLLSPGWGEEISSGEEKRPPVGSAAGRTVEIVFNDDGRMWMVLEIETLELDTPYGKLSIPVEDVRRLTPATRVDEATQSRLDKAIENLASQEFAVREAASKELQGLAEKAYSALLRASRHADPEVVRHARELVNKLKENLPAEKLVVREFDVIETPHSTISGRLLVTSLAVKTSQFGKQSVQLTDLRSLRSVLVEGEEMPDTLPVLADPGSLSGMRDAIGKKFAFRVTGRADGTVYGTGVYTTDSSLATAAVHSGVLKVGQTGIVRVSIVPSPSSFSATTQNGVTSYEWGVYPAAYQVHKLKK